jgi:hypothetical protein
MQRGIERAGAVFSASICAKTLQTLASHGLGPCLVQQEAVEHLVLVSERVYHHEPGAVIDEEDEVAKAGERCSSHGAADV